MDLDSYNYRQNKGFIMGFGKFLIMFFATLGFLAAIYVVIDICAAIYWSNWSPAKDL